jgi:hypothetical protein
MNVELRPFESAAIPKIRTCDREAGISVYRAGARKKQRNYANPSHLRTIPA